MDVNYYGQLVPTLILIPHFMEAKKGHIAFISSLLGLFSAIGYASHAPVKHAQVGLAETLRHELKPYNIDISLLHPADVDTPGFEQENLVKPPETLLISEATKVDSPEEVAEIFVKGILKKKFTILYGIGKILWIILRIEPKIIRFYYDFELKRIRKKLGKI